MAKKYTGIFQRRKSPTFLPGRAILKKMRIVVGTGQTRSLGKKRKKKLDEKYIWCSKKKKILLKAVDKKKQRARDLRKSK